MEKCEICSAKPSILYDCYGLWPMPDGTCYNGYAYACPECKSKHGTGYVVSTFELVDGKYVSKRKQKFEHAKQKHDMEYAALKTILGDDEDGIQSMMEDFGLC